MVCLARHGWLGISGPSGTRTKTSPFCRVADSWITRADSIQAVAVTSTLADSATSFRITVRPWSIEAVKTSVQLWRITISTQVCLVTRTPSREFSTLSNSKSETDTSQDQCSSHHRLWLRVVSVNVRLYRLRCTLWNSLLKLQWRLKNAAAGWIQKWKLKKIKISSRCNFLCLFNRNNFYDSQ